MNRYAKHQELVKKFKLLVTKEAPFMRVFDRTTGVFYAKRVNGGVITYDPVTINSPGMADAYAIVRTRFGFSVHIEIEFKTGNARQSKEQLAWQNYIDNMANSKYFLVRDAKEGIEEIKTYLNSRGLL